MMWRHPIPIDMIVSINIIIIIIVADFHHSGFVAKFMAMLLRMMIHHAIVATVTIFHYILRYTLARAYIFFVFCVCVCVCD